MSCSAESVVVVDENEENLNYWVSIHMNPQGIIKEYCQVTA